jgi:hypothetical protein
MDGVVAVSEGCKPKHNMYRMASDRGFAPNEKYGICSLSGCKKNTVEQWAKQGSWVLGIGGKGTGKPDKLIYAMEVASNLQYRDFRKVYPGKSHCLSGSQAGSNVLISRKFYYFGDKALDLPACLQHIVIKRQGCKCVTQNDIETLKQFLMRNYNCEVHGSPNNAHWRRCKNAMCRPKRSCRRD